MKKITLISLAAAVFLFTGCIDRESKNHPPFEAKTIQTPEQKSALKKLVIKAEADYRAKEKAGKH